MGRGIRQKGPNLGDIGRQVSDIDQDSRYLCGVGDVGGARMSVVTEDVLHLPRAYLIWTGAKAARIRHQFNECL